jgi:prepilin-type N-terminal cleavage/methylation domain-containing protein
MLTRSPAPKRAFTLLELIVVIVILGLLAALAIPTFARVTKKSQDASALTTLRSVARDAQALVAFGDTDWASAAGVVRTEVNRASGGVSAAGLSVVDLAERDPRVPSELGVLAGASGATLALLSASGNVCVVGVSLSAVGGGACATPQDHPSGVGKSLSSDPAVLPGGAAGVGTAPTPAPSTAPAVPLGAPSNVTAVAGDSQVSVSFDLVAGATKYVVTSSSGVVVEGTGSPVLVKGLTNGSPVTFTVLAKNGTAPDSSASAPSAPVTPARAALVATSFSVGGSTTCAVESGALYCWGYNASGQAGVGTADRAVTTRSAVTSMASGVSAVSVGSEHTCAIKSGALYCWGASGSGRLGTGTNAVDQRTPVAVTGMGSGVTSVSAGDNATCAVKDAGLYCWGSNSFGNLGIGSETPQWSPVSVTSMTSGVSAVSVGGANACAVRSGAAYCWGLANNGQLGNGAALAVSSSSKTPVSVSGLSSGVTSISAGSNGTGCAIKSGTRWCWGTNSASQFGNGGTTSSATPAPLGAYSGVAVGYGHGCGVTAAGGLQCWGTNYVGQVGDSTLANRASAVDVVGLGSGVSAVGVGSSHSCALQGNVLKCWGSDSYGQLGDDAVLANQSMPRVSGQ